MLAKFSLAGEVAYVTVASVLGGAGLDLAKEDECESLLVLVRCEYWIIGCPPDFFGRDGRNSCIITIDAVGETIHDQLEKVVNVGLLRMVDRSRGFELVGVGQGAPLVVGQGTTTVEVDT